MRKTQHYQLFKRICKISHIITFTDKITLAIELDGEHHRNGCHRQRNGVYRFTSVVAPEDVEVDITDSNSGVRTFVPKA